MNNYITRKIHLEFEADYEFPKDWDDDNIERYLAETEIFEGGITMDVREKLVELLTEFYGCDPMYYSVDALAIADHLVSNGVTVQECGYWVSLTDCANAGVYCSVCHKKVYKEDYAWCNRKNKLRSEYCPHCGAKMLLQTPKGE